MYDLTSQTLVFLLLLPLFYMIDQKESRPISSSNHVELLEPESKPLTI